MIRVFVQEKRKTAFCERPRNGKSTFNNAGEPTRGPATKSGPLARHAISLDAKHHVIVDTGERFYQDDWDKKEAFVAVK